MKTYRYNNDGKIAYINYSYPGIDASAYAPSTVIGHSYIYDAEGRIYDLQSLQHDAITLHTYHLWYNEDGERISGRIGSPGWLSTTCIKSILNASGKVLKTWEEKVDLDGTPTGEISNMIEYVYDEKGRLLEQIRDNSHTYYHYQDDLLIREECGTYVKNYVYTEYGDLEFVEETIDGNYLARTTYTYSMLYLPDANAAE